MTHPRIFVYKQTCVIRASTLLASIIMFMLVGFSEIAEAQSVSTPMYVVDEVRARKAVEEVLKVSPVLDGHNDLFIRYFDCADCPRDLKDYRIDTVSSGHTDIPRLRSGSVGGVLLNIFGRQRNLDSYLQAWDLLYRMERAYSNDLKVVGTSSEMKEAMKQGKISILPTLEGAVRLGNNMYLLRAYYKLGLRSVTFAYSTNRLADGSEDTVRYNGISAFGKEMVGEMNRLGIVIDMSHISAKSMSDILDVTRAPVIFSHSNVRALCDVNRNVPDSILKRLQKNRGIIMISAVPYFTRNEHNSWMNELDSVENVLYTRYKQNPDDSAVLDRMHEQWLAAHPAPVVTIADLANHFDYVKKLIGVDYMGISGDYDGINFFIKDMEDVSAFPRLLTELARRGWTEKDLRKVTGENFLRVFKEVEKTASELGKSTQPSVVIGNSSEK